MKRRERVTIIVLFIGIALIISTLAMAEEIGKIDLNKATVEDLVKLKGIGQTYAERIIDYREKNGPFKNVQELLAIKGIGEKKLESIKDLLMIGEES
jgi:competence protein ComEA